MIGLYATMITVTHPINISGLSCHLLYQHANYERIVHSAHFCIFIAYMNIVNNDLYNDRTGVSICCVINSNGVLLSGTSCNIDMLYLLQIHKIYIIYREYPYYWYYSYITLIIIIYPHILTWRFSATVEENEEANDDQNHEDFPLCCSSLHLCSIADNLDCFLA